MKTLEFHVENLGPVKNATFSAANLNVICGKNNSGKSFLLHSIYLFLSQWKYQIQVQPKDEHIRSLAESAQVEFDVGDYLPLLNDWIAASTPGFVKELPSMLKKDPARFDGCVFDVSVDPGYAERLAKERFVEGETELVKGCVLKVKKPSGESKVSVQLVNTAKTFPAANVIRLALDIAVLISVVDVLPSPVLLTAERVGTMLYGDDINAFANRDKNKTDADKAKAYIKDAGEAVFGHYPVANSEEIKLLSEMRRSGRSKTWYMQNRDEYKNIYKQFCETVASGVYSKTGDNLMFGTADGEFRVEETSTSVKSLLLLDDYIQYYMRPGSLLMIDEPELNLHLEKQRALVRLLAQIVNKTGAGVAISTHSDTIVREMNSLIALGANSSRFREIMEKHGYVTEECLDVAVVACGVVENGGLDQMPVNARGGFYIRSFDSTIEQISVVQSDIVRLWNDED